MDDYPYDRDLVALVDDAYTDLPLDAMVGEVVDARYPHVSVSDVLQAFDHFFGGITDLRILDDGVDDDLPAPSTWDGSTYRPGTEGGE